MPRTDITRSEHRRDFKRYPTDLTEPEWAVLSPFVPSARTGGRPSTSDMREVVNAILHMAGGGMAWQMLPTDLPPVSKVRGYFYEWRNDGTLALMNYALVQEAWFLTPRLHGAGDARGIDASFVERAQCTRAGKRSRGIPHVVSADRDGIADCGGRHDLCRKSTGPRLRSAGRSGPTLLDHATEQRRLTA